MSKKMPKRDITGKCEGECRDRVKEGEKDRQVALEKEGVKAPKDYPRVLGAEKHVNPDNPPAGMGRTPQVIKSSDLNDLLPTQRGITALNR